MVVVMNEKQDRQVIRTIEQLLRRYDFAGMVKAIKQSETTLNKVEAELRDFVNKALSCFKNLEEIIDGRVDTYYYSGVPSFDNLPASDWPEKDYELHVGDLYYDEDSGYAYRFILNDGEYAWSRTEDAIAQALALANAADDTEDDRRQIFTVEPYPPYANGDLWLRNGEIYVCQISKPEGESFEKNDFIIASEYTFSTLAIKVNNDLTVFKGKVVAKLEMQEDKISWIVKGDDESSFTITEDAIKVLTKALQIDALVKFKNSAEDGSETVINGGAIDAVSLFSRYIEANDLHIKGKSSFEGDVTCLDKIELKTRDGKFTGTISMGEKTVSFDRFHIVKGIVVSASSASVKPCFIINSEFGLYLVGPAYMEEAQIKTLSSGHVYTKYLTAEEITALSAEIAKGLKVGTENGDGTIEATGDINTDGTVKIQGIGLPVPSAIQLYKTADEEGYSTTYNGFCPFNKDVETYSVAYGNLTLDTEVVNYHDREAQTVYGVRVGSGITAVRVNANVSFKNNDTANPRAGYIRICRYRPDTGVLSIYCLSRFTLPAVDPSRATATASALVTVQENDFIFITAYKNNAAADIDVIAGDHGTTMFVEAIH